jgi:hypothetical protein
MKNCACDYFEDDGEDDRRCDNTPTQEDLLCDVCRKGCGVVLSFFKGGDVVDSRHMGMPDGVAYLQSLNSNLRIHQ